MVSSELREAVRLAMKDELEVILSSFGIEENDRRELRQDFIHLRKWRKSVETIERTGWVTAITVITTGVLGALWLGFKSLLGK